MDVPAMERVVMTAIGFLVLILVLSRGVDILLIWMDKHDWILIPNQDAIRNSNERFGRMLTELQAYAEPAKRQINRRKEKDKLKREQDDSGDSPPDPEADLPCSL